MIPLEQWLSGIPLFPILVVALTTIGALAILFVVRDLWEHARNKEPAEPDTQSLLQQLEEMRRPPTLARRLDRGFEYLIHATALPLQADHALGLMALAGSAGALAMYLWQETLPAAATGLVVGLAVPMLLFLGLRGRWQRQVQEELPDVFFSFARALRAGLTVEQSIALLGQQGGPLAGEFRRCAEHLELGLSAPTALQTVAERLRLPDFNFFVSLVTLHRTTGGNLALLVDRLAASCRDRNQYRGYFRAATALGRLSAAFLALAVPGVVALYWITDPSYAARFFESSLGMTLLGSALLLELVGGLWMYFLLKVEY
ncbi:MAG: hypothetical protein C4297_01230 [Gemmataceae bacterium]